MRLDRNLASNRLIAGATRARRRWNQTNWTLAAALALLAIALGYAGFDQILTDERYDVGDVLIRTLQLFVLESNAVAPPVPWELEVARYLAPAVAAYTAVIAVLTLFVNESRRLALRLFGRDHVIVCGAGRRGSSVARNLLAAGYRVAVIDRDKPAAEALGRLGAVVFGDEARDPESLAKAQVARAKALIAMCGDDSRNLEIALVASRVRRSRGMLAVYAHVNELRLMQMLGREGIERTVTGGDARVQFVNFWDLAARHLAEGDAAFEGGSERPHVVLVGFAEGGDSLVLHLARLWRNAGKREKLPVTLVGDRAAESRVAALRSEHPALDLVLDLRPLPDTDELKRLSPPPTSVYVREHGEAESLATALTLRRSFDARATGITIVVDDESGGPAVIGADAAANDIATFGVIRASLAADIIDGGMHEEIARAMHDQYVRTERERGETPETNPSLVPWDELPDALKDSNRRFADAVGEKLERMGCTIVPNPLMRHADGELPLEPAELEELAVAEHDRWCQALLREGWKPTNGAKDPDRKLHPTLVPWDELPEVEKEKDRDAIRGLPQMLARAGFELRRPGGG